MCMHFLLHLKHSVICKHDRMHFTVPGSPQCFFLFVSLLLFLHFSCVFVMFTRYWLLQGGSRDRSICQQMLCWVPDLNDCSAAIEQRAADGTTCANESWCIYGQCVNSPLARQVKGVKL